VTIVEVVVVYDRGNDCDVRRKICERCQPEDEAEDLKRQDGPILVEVGTTISSNKDIDESNDRGNALEAIVSNLKKATSEVVLTVKMLRIKLASAT